MKKIILCAALGGAALAFAGPIAVAKADSNSEFWGGLSNVVDELLLRPSAASAGAAGDALIVSTATNGPGEFLSGSTNALILGPTGIPTPNANYIADAEKLYLNPNGYDGSTATTLALTTPETNDYSTSVPQGESILVNAIVADYNAGDMGCNTAGVCSDPLTIFTYSQSSAVAALAEQQLADDKIPSDALRFVMTGANPTGVPDNLYPTEIYDIHGDAYAEPGSIGTSYQDIVLGMELHEAYLGLTPAEIDSATTAVNGLTIFHDIPTLTSTELWTALISAANAGSFMTS